MRRTVLLTLVCAAATPWVGCSSEGPFGQASYGWQYVVRFERAVWATTRCGAVRGTDIDVVADDCEVETKMIVQGSS